MSVVINTNTTATIAANNLATSNQMLQDSLNKLSSGSKIVNPSDDAGGLAVSMKLSAAANRSAAANNNIGDTTSFLQTQDGVLQVAGSVLNRISELYTLYQDPTKNSTDKANYDAEFTQLQSELTSLGNETFNGVSLFGSSSSLNVQVSQDGTQTVAIASANLTDSTSGVGALTGSSITADSECRDDACDQRCGTEPPRLRLHGAHHQPDEPRSCKQSDQRRRRCAGVHSAGPLQRVGAGRYLNASASESELTDRSETLGLSHSVPPSD